MHGEDRSPEVPVEEVAQRGLADGVRGAAGTDHRDGLGEQQAGDGTRLGALFAGAHDFQGDLGGFEVEGEADDAFVEGLLRGVAGFPEHVDHPPVLRQDVGDEAADAAFPGGGSNVLQHDGGEPAALVGVFDDEGDLGLVLAHLVVADHRDHGVADRGNQGYPVFVVDLGEPLDVAGGELRVGSEEPVVDRLRGEPRVELLEEGGIVRSDRPDVRGAAVGQHHIRFPVLGV